MWFAALGDYHSNPWILRFMMRLLEGSPEVVHLLLSNPFPDGPPHYLRAVLYQYQFTNSYERRKTGNWWKRQPRGEYVPAISLRTLSAVNTLNLVTSNESQHIALRGVWDCHPGFRPQSHSFAAPLGARY